MMKGISRAVLAALLGGSALAVQAADLTGGTTSVAFDPGFLSLLGSVPITPTTIAPSPALGVFPITGNTATTIDHSGGILFSGMKGGSAATLAIEDFTINLTAGDVTGDAIADGTNLGVVPLFTLVKPTGGATAGLDLTPTAIGAINEVFGTHLNTDAKVLVGEATVKGPAAVPEPATASLAAAGLAMLAWVRRRRVAAAV